MKFTNMYKYLLSFSILILIFSSSCEKKEITTNTCGVSNPIEDLSWLKKEINEIEQSNAKYSYYMIAKFNGKSVFFYGNCNPVVNYVSYLRSCSGEIIGNTNLYYTDLTEVDVLWKPENSICNFD